MKLLALAWFVGAAFAAQAQPAPPPSPDDDALSLPSAPEPEPEKPRPRTGGDDDALALAGEPEARPPESGLKAFVEGAAGPLTQRFGLGSETARRLSLDVTWNARPMSGVRTVVSDRLDYIKPEGFGGKALLNSLREAYAGWQSESGENVVEGGRINVRYGPAYGYNPTDFFREGALRAVTTADPLALRENRLGTVMLRGQRLWSGGSASLAVAPRLHDEGPSSRSLSLDLGATNGRNRALGTLSWQPSDRYGGQLLGYWNEGGGSQVGANVTALVTNGIVAQAEYAGGRHLVWQPLPGEDTPDGWRNRFSGGFTFTLPARIALTAEVEYNGAALHRSGFEQLAANGTLVDYITEATRRQDNPSRWTYFLYLTQQNGIVKNLDVTALLRFNRDDHSRFGWFEARYHWPRFDLALQVQASGGSSSSSSSEYGAVPVKRLVQLLGAFYF